MAKVLLLKSDCLPHQSGCCLPYGLSAFMLCLLNLHKIKHKKQLAEEVCAVCFQLRILTDPFTTSVGFYCTHVKRKRITLLQTKPFSLCPAEVLCITSFLVKEQLKTKQKPCIWSCISFKIHLKADSPLRPNLDTLKHHLQRDDWLWQLFQKARN